MKKTLLFVLAIIGLFAFDNVWCRKRHIHIHHKGLSSTLLKNDHVHRGNTTLGTLRSGTTGGLSLSSGASAGRNKLEQAVQWGVSLKAGGERFINTQSVKAKDEIKTMMSSKEFSDNDNGKEKVARANAMMVGVGKGVVNMAKGAKSGDAIMAMTGVLGLYIFQIPFLIDYRAYD